MSIEIITTAKTFSSTDSQVTIVSRVYNKEGGKVSYYTIVLYYSCMINFQPLNLIIHELVYQVLDLVNLNFVQIANEIAIR